MSNSSPVAASPVAASPGAGSPAVGATSSYAVLVDPSGAPQYSVFLVSKDGSVADDVQATQRSQVSTPTMDYGTQAMDLPYVSASRSRVYYLDGDTTLRWLAPDGSTGVATSLPGGTTSRAAFAVSPDDQRIAVALFDYAPRPPVVHLSVGPLNGPRAEIFSSTSDYEWPVGWHGGDLVLASQTQAPFSQSGLQFNPYFGEIYYLFDLTSRTRVATIGTPQDVNFCWPSGLLTTAGTACYLSTAFGGRSGGYSAMNWTGTRFLRAMPGAWSVVSAIAPTGDATRIAVCCEGMQTSGRYQLSTASDDISILPLRGDSGHWACWIDSTHLFSWVSRQVIDLDTMQVTPSQGRGNCVAILPTDLG